MTYQKKNEKEQEIKKQVVKEEIIYYLQNLIECVLKHVNNLFNAAN